MRRVLTGVGWALGGLIVALVLTFGAFALAGQELSTPAGGPVISSQSPSDHDGGEDASHSPEQGKTESPSTSPEDHGAGLDDNSGSSSGSEDSSGSGSDSSGSRSGSGSDDDHSDDSSGSGSDDDEHDDD
jgi:hypothetical protein